MQAPSAIAAIAAANAPALMSASRVRQPRGFGLASRRVSVPGRGAGAKWRNIMRAILIALTIATAAACSPPPAAEAPAPAADAATEAAPAADLGPYTNTWDSAEFSRFRHTLNAPAAGDYAVTLAATTTSPGGETVAIYPIGPDDAPATDRVMFVIATTGGGSETRSVTIPAEGLPVEVVVENASGRRFAGEYSITVAAP